MATDTVNLESVLREHGIPKDGGMPTEDELTRALVVMYTAYEAFVSPLQHRVLALLNDDDREPVSHEEIGRLIVGLDDLREYLDDMQECMRRLEKSRRDLGSATFDGNGFTPRFDKDGKRNYVYAE